VEFSPLLGSKSTDIRAPNTEDGLLTASLQDIAESVQELRIAF